jgi:hypothetical protein
MQKHAIDQPIPPIHVRLQNKQLWSAVEAFRRNEPDIPTRPEAIRRVLERALLPKPEQRKAAVG